MTNQQIVLEALKRAQKRDLEVSGNRYDGYYSAKTVLFYVEGLNIKQVVNALRSLEKKGTITVITMRTQTVKQTRNGQSSNTSFYTPPRD